MKGRVDARSQRGNAILEFQAFGLLLLLPLVYVLLTALDVQRTAFAATHAAREAGRVAVVSGDEASARAAAAIAFADQGLTPADATVSFTCSPSCQTAGGEVTVTVSTVVRLPFLPDALGEAGRARIPVQAVHVATFDRFASTA